ncbi:MAG: hypothetical protein E7281_09345 [Lachnospiraceae bacterium]|nr:hypothetical protein [Lachnospiraceae bacterium]
MNNTKRKNRNIQFVVLMILLSGIMFFQNYTGVLNKYNSTILSLNYSHGFICRGLLGTIYMIIDRILQIDMLDYPKAVGFYLIASILILVLVLRFCQLVISKTTDNTRERSIFLAFLLVCIIVPTFAAENNFGRIDLFMMACSLMGAVLIIERKCEWLVLPLAIMGVMFHEGYVLMYLNILLVLLFYRWMTEDHSFKYGLLFVLTFLGASVLFLYFHFFSFAGGEDIVREVALNARRLSLNGTYHISLVQAEILGVDLGNVEKLYHLRNIVEFPVFAVFTLPIWLPVLRFYIKLFKRACDIKAKLKYLALAVGPLTLLPDFMFKVDYGRWVLALIIYYIVIMMFLIAEKDEDAMRAFDEVEFKGIHKYVYWFFVIAYTMCFVPYADVSIDIIMGRTYAILDDCFLHITLK